MAIVVAIILWGRNYFGIGVQIGAIVMNLVASGVVLRWCYTSLDVVGRKAEATAQATKIRNGIRQTETAIASILAERERVMEPLLLLDKEYRAMPAKLQADLQATLNHLEQSLAKIADRRVSLTEREADALRQSEDWHMNEIRSLNTQLGAVGYAETNEIGRLGSALRDRHLLTALQQATLSGASIANIGGKMKDRFRQYGIYCAADVDARLYNVPGMGPTKIKAMQDWRAGVTYKASLTVPQPNTADMLAVKGRCEQQRQRLLAQINAVKIGEEQKRQELVGNFTRYGWDVDQEEVDAKRRHDEDAAATRQKHENRSREVADRFRREKDHAFARQREHDEQLARLQQSLFGQQLDACKVQRESERYRDVSFKPYVARIFGLRRLA